MALDPAQALPLDVLNDIFLLCRTQFSPVDTPLQAVSLMPRTISQVSRTWRSIALSTPLLWSIVSLQLLSQMDSDSAEQWLSNSAGCPLSLDLRPTLYPVTHDPLSLIHRHLSRIYELSVYLSHLRPVRSPLLSLKKLSIFWWKDRGVAPGKSGYERLEDLLEAAPCLREVSVTTDMLLLVKGVATKLVYLDLNLKAPVCELHDILLTCPNLTELYFGCCTSSETLKEGPSSTVLLEELRVLSTSMIGGNGVQYCILKGLVVPKLLEGRFLWWEGEVTKSILQPVLCSSRCLRSLTLRCLSGLGDHMIDMLRQLPSLVAFTLTHALSMGEFFAATPEIPPADLLVDHLKYDCSKLKSSVLLPLLESLFIDSAFAVKEQQFLEMLESRCWAICSLPTDSGEAVRRDDDSSHSHSHVARLKEVAVSLEFSDLGLARIEACCRAGLQIRAPSATW